MAELIGLIASIIAITDAISKSYQKIQKVHGLHEVRMKTFPLEVFGPRVPKENQLLTSKTVLPTYL